jgi:hypothetical protein
MNQKHVSFSLDHGAESFCEDGEVATNNPNDWNKGGDAMAEISFRKKSTHPTKRTTQK